MHASLAIALGSALVVGATVASLAAGAPNRQPIAINFALTNDGKQVGCAAPLPNLGSGRVEAKLREARFYVSDVKLIDKKGGRTPVALAQNDWQYADLALIDFKDARGGNAPCSPSNPAKNAAITGTAPAGSYVGLEFSVGVPVESQIEGKAIGLNHSNVETAPPPLDIQAMAWNWQAGRKFLLVEVDPQGLVAKADGSKAKTWMVHLGSSGCKGNPATGEIVSCTHPNRFTVTLDRFDARTEQVALDLTTLFKDSDISVDKGGAVGCMTALDDPECPALFKAMGLNLTETAPGASDGGLQTKPGVSPIFSAGPIAAVVGAKK
jgi:uncharacterized repeat protein (TIGR04052 family)